VIKSDGRREPFDRQKLLSGHPGGFGQEADQPPDAIEHVVDQIIEVPAV
jgi:transcriptional regulator NrdR family protein